MKTLVFILSVIAGLALVSWQHEQFRQLWAENSTLQQSATEAEQLKADLEKSAGDTAQDAEEIARLREENRDLLKLRNEVNQLRDARVEFEKVSAENQRLRSRPQPAATPTLFQPIVININELDNRGRSTPEATLQTFYWAQRNVNADAISRCMTAQSWQSIRGYFETGMRRQSIDSLTAIEIVARREMNATTIQLGVQLHTSRGGPEQSIVYTLTLQDGEWKLDIIGSTWGHSL